MFYPNTAAPPCAISPIWSRTHGPFDTDELRDTHARELRAGDDQELHDGIYWLNVLPDGKITCGAYSGTFFTGGRIMIPAQLDLFVRPAIERRAEIPAGAVFTFGGRPLCVYRVYGTDAAAPVIVEELAAFGSTLKGQFALWSADAVTRCLARGAR